MKEQLNTDTLFQKAAKASAISSFGETKELFLSTVGLTKVNYDLGKARLLTLKDALIMLATVSTIIFLIPGNNLDENQSNKEEVVVSNVRVKDSTVTTRNQFVNGNE
jgi:hypothetical protein